MLSVIIRITFNDFQLLLVIERKNMDTEKYIGLSKRNAQNLAEAQNLIFRLISVDGEPYFGMPEDKRTDRICVEIVAGKVSSAKAC